MQNVWLGSCIVVWVGQLLYRSLGWAVVVSVSLGWAVVVSVSLGWAVVVSLSLGWAVVL